MVKGGRIRALAVATAVAVAAAGPVVAADADDVDVGGLFATYQGQFEHDDATELAAAIPVVAQAGEADDNAYDEDVNDPLEPLNRAIFFFNEAFQTLLLRPAAGFYRALVPPPIQDALSNVLDNLETPVILANDLLQGETDRAWETTQRFFINTTWGIGGIFDRADEMGIPRHEEDFGQTLAVWGVGEGFYVVLPVFGPSNPRDAVGKLVVDRYLDPLDLWLDNTDRDEVVWSRLVLEGIVEYESVMDELDKVKKTSIDYYAAIRSMFRQRRNSEINNGESLDLPPIPDLSIFDDEDETQPASIDRPGGFPGN